MFKLSWLTAVLMAVLSCWSLSVNAARAVDLREETLATLPHFLLSNSSFSWVSRDVDFKQTTHVRFRQFYRGVPVWGTNAILHAPNHPVINNDETLQRWLQHPTLRTTLNGIVFLNVDEDLRAIPMPSPASAQQALQHAIKQYQQQSHAQVLIEPIETQLIVYLDEEQRAHWAYHISFWDRHAPLPKKLIYLTDATTFAVYKSWNDIKTIDTIFGGGYGGNPKIGKLSYDGLAGDLPTLTLQRDSDTKLCYLQNNDVAVRNLRANKAVINFSCAELSTQHAGLYWDADLEKTNGAFSPANDALYVGATVKSMYETWYGIPPLVKDDKPMLLTMLIHDGLDNAYWDGFEMVFGDGGKSFYPFVSLSVGAHEISHGFTQQNANFEYEGQPGALNEAFSDMASQALEFYLTGKNTWQIGAEITRSAKPLRYLDEPSRDCKSNDLPGEDCSISHAKDYRSNQDVHYTSGVFNKLFYLLSTSPQWDTKKAFDVMVLANRDYWTATDNFSAAACGVLDATKQYGYDTETVRKTIAAVGVKVVHC